MRVTPKFKVSDRVQVMAENPGGTNRTTFPIRGKKGVVVFYHGPMGNPTDLSYGGTGEPELPAYGVSFHMAHLYDDDPDFVHDRLIVDVLEDWLQPVSNEGPKWEPINLEEHDQTYYEKRIMAIQNLLVQKDVINIDESRRLVAELDFQKRGQSHPMASPWSSTHP